MINLLILSLFFTLFIWLIRGGPTRIAAFGGWLVGVAAGVLVWRVGQPYVWIIDVILRNIDPAAVAFTSLVSIGLLFFIMRWAAGLGTQFFTWLIEWGHRQETAWRLRRAVQAQQG